MEATRIIAVRHGETAWNVDTRIQGQTDIGLNDTGRWQADRLGEALAGEPLDAVYTSDLSRARQTAQAIVRHRPMTVIPHRGLRERCFGMFEGHTFDEIHQAWPEHALSWRKRVPDWAPPAGGESLLALRARVAAAVRDVSQAHGGQQIVLVAHGGVLDALYRLATGQEVDSPRTWQLPNGAINRLLWTPSGLALVGWSDVRHLDQEAIDESTT